MLVIDKPSVITDPPDLPPFLRKREGGPERRVIILPDIRWIKCRTETINDHENNWKTIIYGWMNRVTGEGGVFDLNARWESAHSHSRRYRQWLETYECKDGVPPHISFGGCIQSGEADPTFYPRWVEWARSYFC